MSYYQRLGIKNVVHSNALDIVRVEKKQYTKHGLVYTRPENILSDECIDLFKRIGVTPVYALLLGTAGIKKHRTLIHSDITLHEGEWVPVPAALNIELSDSISHMKWYDTQAHKAYYPDKEIVPVQWDFPNSLSASVHYGSRKYSVDDKDDFESDLTVLDTAMIGKSMPYLVRTNIAHSADIYASDSNRISISLRFKPTDFLSWEDAEDKFRSVIL